MSEVIKNDQMQICPQCNNHCSVDALQCERGRKYFGVKDSGQGHGHHHHHHRDGLGGLLHQCGRFVCHSELEDAALFQALTNEEKAALQAALEKLAADWKVRCGEESFSHGHHHDHGGEGRHHKHGDHDK